MTDPTDADPPDDHRPHAALAVVDAPPEPDELEVVEVRRPPVPDEDRPSPASPSRPPWAERAARRIVQRPTAWAQRPWPTERIVKVIVTGVSLFITTYVMMNVVHFNPLNPGADLVLDRTTPTGGDMGAHVWGPAYLRDNLLPHWQLNGWSMDWYAGMPTYRFYMVVPALAIVALDVVFPYGVAFKLVVIAGLVTLPFCCWAFGRLARFRYPLPELFAFAGLAFALDESYSIYGGNVKSTMAGEFSFSIALSLMILGFGLLARSMETGKYRSWTAIVLALAIVCHGIVAIYTVLGAAVIVLVVVLGRHDPTRRFLHGLGIGIAVVLLSMWWIGPFVGNHQYMTDMKYGARPDGANDSFWDMFFPLTAPLDVLITTLAVIGFVACIARRQLVGTAVGVTAMLTVALVYLTQDSLPVIGLLWNPRLLPFLYLLRWPADDGRRARGRRRGGEPVAQALLAGRGRLDRWDGDVGRGRAERAARPRLHVRGPPPAAASGCSTTPPSRCTRGARSARPPPATTPLGDSWARYNFTGYEGKPHYPVYYDVVQTMAEIGRTNGCGRVTWENSGQAPNDNGQYGTTMALMLLPHWTDGCMASMEGLFFEASGRRRTTS